MGLPGVGPFFVAVVERIWNSPAARSGFTDKFEVFEKTQEVITSIATAFVLPGIAADYPGADRDEPDVDGDVGDRLRAGADATEEADIAGLSQCRYLHIHGECWTGHCCTSTATVRAMCTPRPRWWRHHFVTDFVTDKLERKSRIRDGKQAQRSTLRRLPTGQSTPAEPSGDPA
jgi:hypothetical protein